MEPTRRFFHDRLVLLLTAVIAVMLVVGVSLILFRFDVSKNPTTIVAWRPNVSGASYQSGKPIDIYAMAVFMALTALAAIVLGARTYQIKHYIAIFVLGSSLLLLVLTTIVANALISLQ
ncbi:hypothetical protein A3F65_00025 [Candidatus Saccharibacteria bacterium RIFCSPHIGHO2_12_FULL_47_16b]|nr:MAG: hypothetical protein A3F65_00025 [Candidatus Saccharibacteria bacterium RIFCSPHIGHO2_12_FULL_47_16b]OGL39266.1 MAG: hypothetical protein A3J32_02415 [Candidatus Saccharibacteria bacterium RIFCSPLOWO2_02_FULL_46_7]